MTHSNRLARETSPYLLQHAHNPVDWHPWGAEAFETARRENKPIFLSVGYSTCYWCHVMERQCFEVQAIADEMNKRFVNIKVDREERPDVDQLYMNAVQIITRQGGWPMSVFLTPDLKPFYGGTYFPPQDSHGRPGFVRILQSVEDAWLNRPDEVIASAGQITNILKQMAQPPATSSAITLDMNWVESMIARSTADYDPQNGGYGSAPKFPRQTVLQLVLAYLQLFPNDGILAHLRHTLDAMAQGGIRDQLGGAFHRYSTDAQWLVPHFEIMLYDNAMLAWVYAEAYRQTEDLRYAAVARGICDFVLRKMTSPQGAFYTAFDAEVDGQEGQNYLWTQSEVEEILATAGISAGEVARFCKVYGLDQGPNFTDPHHGDGRAEKNVLYLAEPQSGSTPALLDSALSAMRGLLYASRRDRKQPLLDTKILTSWNALMIRGLAHAGEVLQEDRYLKAAEACADFLLLHHRDDNGGLYRTSRDAKAKYAGFLDDYAYLVQALLALRAAGDDEKRGDQARELALIMKQRFGESADGGFYFTEQGAPDLIVRQKTAADSPLPSGNAFAAMALLELDQPELAKTTIATFAAQLEQVGESMSALVEATMFYVHRHGAIEVAPRQPRVDSALAPAQVAGQAVTLHPAWAEPTLLNVRLEIVEGFHINGHETPAPMTPTNLSVSPNEDVSAIEFPAAQPMWFEFSETPIMVYSGEIVISVRFARPQSGQGAVELSLQYQACNDNACFPVTSRRATINRP